MWLCSAVGSVPPSAMTSRFARLIPLTGGRAYSSFFSSKPGGGGGRYFNSAKPPKVVVPAKKVDSMTEPNKPEPVQTSSATGTPVIGNGASNTIVNANPEEPHSSSSQPSPSSSNSTETSNARAKSTRSSGEGFSILRQHPIVTSKDFKLLQFFSLHRPLLHISNPISILDFSATAPFEPEKYGNATNGSKSTWLLNEFSEASVDADADAATARQLSRALIMTHAGASVAWEDTLRRLGLDLEKDVDRIQTRAQMDREWEEVTMDSTKRKRGKKMKKHKYISFSI